ncbi:MAG: N-acylneuraminate cytidylyltransferase [Nitrospirota bacterium]
MKRDLVALVPLRGGSKSIPGKNIKSIAGRPLCAWVIEAACKAVGTENVFVSTDSREIAEVVGSQHPGVTIIDRPSVLATDSASTESVMLHFAGKVEFSTLITLQATSPLTIADDIKRALDLFNTRKYDSLLTGVRTKRFFWTDDGKAVNYDPLKRPLRQNFDGWIMENGAFYITKREILKKHGCRLGGNIGVFEMAAETAVEIDEPEDWAEVERLLNKRNKLAATALLKGIKLLAIDVDGTLTDGGMYYSESGEELKKFNTRDGQGLELLRNEGIEVAIITKENSPIARARAEKLKIARCHIGITGKLGCLKTICDEMKITLADVAYIGDDVSDLECMKAAGFAACPSDASEDIMKISHYICRHSGGGGAVREVCELLIQCLTEKD